MATVTTLLLRGEDIDRGTNSGASPLFVAAQMGHGAVVRLLAERADINRARDDGVTPLIIASQEGHESIVKLLLRRGADIDKILIRK